MSEEQKPVEGGLTPGDQATLGMKIGVSMNLVVHLDDGTTKELTLVGHNFRMEKEQDNGNHQRS